MSQLLDDLRALRELLSQPGSWTQKCDAKNEDGKETGGPLASDAVSWCLVGGIRKVLGSSAPLFVEDSRMLALHHAVRAVVDGSLVDWNDSKSRTHGEVLAVLDEAIERQKVLEF